MLLCRVHHRLVHEGGWRVASDTDGRAVFFTPHGKAVGAAPPMPLADSDALLRRNRDRGVVEPDWRAGLPPADAA
jgi:hypothetical protein